MITWPVFMKKKKKIFIEGPRHHLLGPLCNTWPGEQGAPPLQGWMGYLRRSPGSAGIFQRGLWVRAQPPASEMPAVWRTCSVPDAELSPGLLGSGVLNQLGELMAVCTGLGNAGLEGTRG